MDNDLISRSALLKEIEPDKGAMRGVCFLDKTLAMNLEALKRMIIQAPAVDAEPVRHGRWEHGMRCPYCGQIDLAKPNYCCQCGAKMDGDVDGKE